MNELRQELSAAFDGEEVEEDQEAEIEETKSEETQEPSTEEVADEVKTEEASEEVETPEVSGGSSAGEEAIEAKEESSGEVSEAKAPASWSPKAREGWDKLSSDAKNQVVKREQEVNDVLQDSAQARQLASQLHQMLSPHKEALIASGARNPIDAIGNLLQNEARLRVGSPVQKAAAVADMINQYGIDIGMLDNELSGSPQSQSPNASLESLIDERMAPMNQFLQQQQYQVQIQMDDSQNIATNSVNEFSKNAEFINDVRGDMANMMDLAASRHEEMPLQKAYEMACAMNPEVSTILKQRTEQQRILGNNDTMASKKKAAASVTGSRGGAGGSSDNNSIRGLIDDAWAEQQG